MDAIDGYAALSICELASGAIGDKANNSSAANNVSNAYGIASLLTAIGSIIAGVLIARAGIWSGIDRWILLVSGVLMVVLVTPASISNNEVFVTVGLVVWSLTFIPLGRAIYRSAPTIHS